MNVCIVIPVYNHEMAIPHVVAKLKNFGIPTLLINDGSSAICTHVLTNCVEYESSWLTLINRFQNGGKGAAVLEGFKTAHTLGFTHAIQIDADGQHDFNDIPKFIDASQNHPTALLLGQPLFDKNAPKSRVYGRRITNFWVAINTLSLSIGDGMCGFRLYPLDAVKVLMDTTQIAKRMNFDIDILVRLHWQNVNIINIPTNVIYPYDGISHFKLWRDNLMISKTHAKLFFGMLMHIPQLLKRHFA